MGIGHRAARGSSVPQHHGAAAGATSPQLWILGSSDYGAQLAAHFGLPYAYAYFFTEGAGVEEAIGSISPQLPAHRALSESAQATICVWALAADTESEAQRLAMTREYWRAGFEKGLRMPLGFAGARPPPTPTRTPNAA